MSSSDHQPGSDRNGPNWSRIYPRLLWLGLAAAVAWLSFGHGEHLLKVAPFLILLACPLMHLFGHGHGGREDHSRRDGAPAAKQAAGRCRIGRRRSCALSHRPARRWMRGRTPALICVNRRSVPTDSLARVNSNQRSFT
jgi:hypothetical protein